MVQAVTAVLLCCLPALLSAIHVTVAPWQQYGGDAAHTSNTHLSQPLPGSSSLWALSI
jgi:hypothetical protein